MGDNSQRGKPRPVAFMVMPFRERTVPSPPKGAPATIDFDALWDKAFRPALEDLGYLAIRADIEIGSVIVKDMLERLALAELVLADLTLPNGNVYYEVGLRHVARRTHCVLIAADWSQQLFDTDQIRTDRYPLKNGKVPDKEAEAIRRMLLEVIPKKKHSPTPYYELVTGKQDSSVFREQIAKISEFQAQSEPCGCWGTRPSGKPKSVNCAISSHRQALICRRWRSSSSRLSATVLAGRS